MNHIILEKDNNEHDLAYWKTKLGEELTELNLPFDHPRPLVSNLVSDNYDFTIPSNSYEGIKTISNGENVTPSIIIMAVLKILLHRYSGEDDICIGTQLGKEIGTLVIKTQMQEDMTFRDALYEVKKASQEANEHQSIPFATLVKEIGKTNRLFQVMLDVKNMQFPNREEMVDTDHDTPFVDLILKVTKEQKELKCSLRYDKDLFEKETIIRMEGHFINLLEGVLNTPERPVSRIPILTAQEKHKLLVEWNSPTIEYPRESSIDQLFEEQVRLHPNKVAVVFEDTEMTYRELNIRANQIANYLRELNIVEGQLVAICLNRSIDMIASFLGVLKAGGAYLPFDLAYPKERIAYMLEDSGASFVITTGQIAKELPTVDSKVICLDEEAEAIAIRSEECVHRTGAESLAYVMYTSGSTGKPKGVAIAHRGVVRLVKNITYANVGPEVIILNRASVSFDVSAFEIYGSLLNGGKLVIMNSHKPSFGEISTMIREKRVTTLRIGPDMLNILIEDYREHLGSLRQVFCGGEVLPVWLADKFLSKLKGCQLFNSYGPTENTVNTTTYHVKEILPNITSIPIGRPISNDRIYILDKSHQPVPVGVIGELYMTGDGIAKGYLNNPELTQERFFLDPSSNKLGQKIYRSGDLVRYHSDGNIEFIGRIDDQVKIRGTRIELGEVETIISLFPGIRQSVAGTIKNKSGMNELVAYVVMNKGESFDQQRLRSYVRKKLPENMIPTFFIELQNIPVTPVGKIDRKKLPSPIISLSKQFIQPRNQIEEQLVHLWEKLLDVKPIGITDHYFELGGNSLLAMQMFADVEKTFNKNLPVSIIFQEDTIEKLSRHVMADDKLTDISSSLVPIQPQGTKTPLFCIHGGGGEVLVYGDLATELGPERPLYGLRFIKNEGDNTSTSVESLANKYIEEIRKVQPTGPYFLFGYCFGGAIAYEMAQILFQQEQEVSLLTILNFANPKRQHVEVRNEINYMKIIKNNLKLLFNMPLKKRASFFTQKVSNALKLANSKPDIQSNVDVATQIKIVLGKAIKVYKPKPYPGELLLIRANEYSDFEENLGWQTTSNGNIHEHRIAAEHEDLLKEPNVELVVKYLKGQLKMEKQ